MVKNEPTFLHSCILDGTGGAKFVDASSVAGWTKDQGVLWVHLDVNDDASRLWLAEHGGLDSTIVESLLADETRPRSYSTDNGLLTVLRGVNTNPGEDPEDMVSVRLWIEPDRIISTRRRRLLSIVDTRDSLEKGVGPETSGGFLAALTGRMADRIGDFVDGIEDDVGAAEEQLGNQGTRQRFAM
jgi:zinc transporter